MKQVIDITKNNKKWSIETLTYWTDSPSSCYSGAHTLASALLDGIRNNCIDRVTELYVTVNRNRITRDEAIKIVSDKYENNFILDEYIAACNLIN